MLMIGFYMNYCIKMTFIFSIIFLIAFFIDLNLYLHFQYMVKLNSRLFQKIKFKKLFIIFFEIQFL